MHNEAQAGDRRRENLELVPGPTCFHVFSMPEDSMRTKTMPKEISMAFLSVVKWLRPSTNTIRIRILCKWQKKLRCELVFCEIC